MKWSEYMLDKTILLDYLSSSDKVGFNSSIELDNLIEVVGIPKNIKNLTFNAGLLLKLFKGLEDDIQHQGLIIQRQLLCPV